MKKQKKIEELSYQEYLIHWSEDAKPQWDEIVADKINELIEVVNSLSERGRK